jgi:hypothetical protein
MQYGKWRTCTLGVIGVVLALGIFTFGSGAPAYGTDKPAKARSVATDVQKDQQDLTQLRMDVSRLSTEMKVTLATAIPSSGIVPADADEVSAAIAALFASYAQEYQALGAQATALHDQFTHTLAPGSSQYASVVAAAAAPAAAWLATTAQQDERAATQARATATQFEHGLRGSGSKAPPGG